MAIQFFVEIDHNARRAEWPQKLFYDQSPWKLRGWAGIQTCDNWICKQKHYWPWDGTLPVCFHRNKIIYQDTTSTLPSNPLISAAIPLDLFGTYPNCPIIWTTYKEILSKEIQTPDTPTMTFHHLDLCSSLDVPDSYSFVYTSTCQTCLI